MNSKTKNNILIIAIVTLSALTVIALVLITGFSKSGSGAGGQSSASEDTFYSSEPEESSEPISEPEESSAVESEDSSQPVSDDTGRQITELAGSLIGTPFAENGSSPDGFDNSGFIYYVLRENGYIACPRTTEAQAKMGTRVGRDSLKAGDLVFFGNESGDTADFGGIYIGGGKMIACLMPGTTVKEIDITNDYYISNFYGGISLA